MISPSKYGNGKTLGLLPEWSEDTRLEMDERHETRAGSRTGSGCESHSLVELIGSLFEGKFCGQVQHLQVVCSEGQLILRGCTRTYHVKQLAQQAVLDLTGGHPLLVNLITVS
jgi:hypothetical protein